LSGIPGTSGALSKAAETLRTKKGRSVAGAVAGSLVLTGALIAVGANSHADDLHKKAEATAEATRLAAAQASASASSASADAAAQASASAASASASSASASASTSAAAKAAADKAAADKLAADRAAAAAAANRDLQRQALPTTSAPVTSTPTTHAPVTSSPTTTITYAPVTSGSARAIAQSIVPSGQFGCFDWIIQRESGWNIHATNPSSGAYGLPQALPGSKMASAGSDWQNNPATQIKWALGYMDSRYGSPCGAQSFWQSHGWY
jgi:hypothetical protein